MGRNELLSDLIISGGNGRAWVTKHKSDIDYRLACPYCLKRGSIMYKDVKSFYEKMMFSAHVHMELRCGECKNLYWF